MSLMNEKKLIDEALKLRSTLDKSFVTLNHAINTNNHTKIMCVSDELTRQVMNSNKAIDEVYNAKD